MTAKEHNRLLSIFFFIQGGLQLFGGLLVASGLLLQYQRQLGTIGFTVAAAIGLYMVISILITDRRTSKGDKKPR